MMIINIISIIVNIIIYIIISMTTDAAAENI